MDWAELFFSLHRYCGLNKFEIWSYTLPQVHYLMKKINRHIEFQIEVQMRSMGIVTGGGVASNSDDGYEIATEDDIDLLAKAFGS